MRNARITFNDAALDLLCELESARLEVVLIPADEQKHSGHCVRAVQSANAAWYRQLCDEHQTRRTRPRTKSDTLIKRQHTIKALERIISGDTRGEYAARLMPFIKARLNALRQTKRATIPAPLIRSAAPHDFALCF